MLEFLYTKDYNEIPLTKRAHSVTSDEENFVYGRFVINIKVYLLAEKYGVMDLKTCVAEKYKLLAASSLMSNVPDFAASLDLLYISELPDTDRELKDIAMEVAVNTMVVDKMNDLVIVKDSKEVYDKSLVFQELLKENGDVGLDIIKYVTKKRQEANKKEAVLTFSNQPPTVSRVIQRCQYCNSTNLHHMPAAGLYRCYDCARLS